METNVIKWDKQRKEKKGKRKFLGKDNEVDSY